MKPETKRTATIRRRNSGKCGSSTPFNLSSLKHEIDSIDAAAQKSSINLSSLSAALSAASREMKQTERYQSKRVRERRKKKKDNKKLLIGEKPETYAELQQRISKLDESLKTLMEPQICEFNTVVTMDHCSESFRSYWDILGNGVGR